MMNWTVADDIAYCEAAAETEWDFEDIQFLKSQNPQPPKKTSDLTKEKSKE
jgi:hypothetical protein